MPIYEYECQQCGEVTEVMQRITEDPLTTCEICGGPIKRLISNTSFVLKGTGWYATDYAGKSNGANGSGGKRSTETNLSGSSDKKETGTEKTKSAEKSTPASE
ncbi:MAG: zinc ribbon domain-containing protein [Deltaproteobacteria bacterium]|nr:zinc ribbon domain-containing protein [Candidatus Zymogenaceae bacterium]